MKDNEILDDVLTLSNSKFLSKYLGGIIRLIFSFLTRLGLRCDFPDFIRERLREEQGENYLREIEERRIKRHEEFFMSFFTKEKKLIFFNTDPEDFRMKFQYGMIGLTKRVIEYLETLALMEEYMKALNEDEKTIFKKIIMILKNFYLNNTKLI